MFILYLLPALGWGVMPIIASLTKTKPIEQLIGTTIVACLCGMSIFFYRQPVLEKELFLITFLSGCFWSVGQYLQFYSFQLLPVSEAMPISNGSQLIGTTLIAVVFFQEWQSSSAFLLGAIGITMIILGIICTSFKERRQVVSTHKNYRRALYLLLISSSALIIYITLPKAFSISGAAIFFPQSLGMLVSSIFIKINRKESIQKSGIIRNLLTGFTWSFANLSLFLLIPIIGVAKSFTFSQLAVLISIFGGLYLLNLKKTPKELSLIILGALLITIGIILVGAIKK